MLIDVLEASDTAAAVALDIAAAAEFGLNPCESLTLIMAYVNVNCSSLFFIFQFTLYRLLSLILSFLSKFTVVDAAAGVADGLDAAG